MPTSKSKLHAPEQFSTATIIWSIILVTGLTVFLLTIFFDVVLLSVIAGGMSIVGFFGTLASFSIHQERKAKYRYELAEAQAEKERLEAEGKKVEQQRRLAEWSKHHDKACYTVKGVTFPNDDGSSRQNNLKALYDAITIEDYPEVTFVPCQVESEPAVRIMASGLQIGYIDALLVAGFMNILPRIEYARLDVEPFVPKGETHKIYRADVYVVYTK